MKRQIVVYKAKPEADAENQRLLEKVFGELHAKQPADFRYLLARMEDGTYVHLVFNENDGPLPLNQLDSFKAYQEKVRERLVAPPQTGLATVIGDYRMLKS